MPFHLANVSRFNLSSICKHHWNSLPIVNGGKLDSILLKYRCFYSLKVLNSNIRPKQRSWHFSRVTLDVQIIRRCLPVICFRFRKPDFRHIGYVKSEWLSQFIPRIKGSNFFFFLSGTAVHSIFNEAKSGY